MHVYAFLLKQTNNPNKQTNPYYFPEFLTHSCNWSLSLAGFGCTQKSPGIFSGWAGMLFLLVASLPCKHFFLFSCIYLFVQTHSNPSVYLCMSALMSSRSYSFHPCKIVWGWYKSSKYLARGNGLGWMNGSCEWRRPWQPWSHRCETRRAEAMPLCPKAA